MPTYSKVVLFAAVAVKTVRTLHLNESYKALGDFKVLVSKLLEVVLHCWKRSQPRLGYRQVTVAKISAAETLVLEMGKNCEKQAQG